MTLRIDGVEKRIADFRLAADFEVAPGERAVLLGRSGCGKTSLLRLIAGLELLEPARRDRGRIFLDDQEITALSPEMRDIGMVFQEQTLFPALNVIENSVFGLRLRGISGDERERMGMEWLRKLDLHPRAHASIDTLSGGEKQRVSFIRAVIWKPKLLLLDEPFSALDASLRDVLRRELVELHRLHPVPLLMVTHDEADVDAIATSRVEIQIESGTDLRRCVKRGAAS